MAKNSNITKLDVSQIPIRTFDELNDALRVVFAGGQLAISLHASEDSITCIPNFKSLKFSTQVQATSDILNIADIKEFSVYTTAISNSYVVEVSPSLTEDVWFPVSLTNVNPVCAARLKIRTLTAYESAVDFYLVGRS